MTIQEVTQLTNDLSQLLFLGHIYVTNLPSQIELSAPYVNEETSTERWADIEWLPQPYHPLFHNLKQLQLQAYILCTFQVMGSLARISVYTLAADHERIWPVLNWRKKPLTALRLQWYRMLYGISIGQNIFIVDYADADASWDWDRAPIEKWIPDLVRDGDSLLDARVKRIYSLVSPPNITSAKSSCQSIPTTSDLVASVLDGRIRGIKSKLFRYQKESVAAMLQYEREEPRSIPVPHYVQFTGGAYYDLLTDQIFYHLDHIRLPRGGILAENMGLGKTLICLAVVCATKHQQTVRPREEEMVTGDLDEEKAIGDGKVTNLTQLCLDQIKNKSLPWKYYGDDLPVHIRDKLHDNPGGFSISLLGNSYDQYSQIRLRQSSRLPENDVRRNLWLSSLTLVVVPDNLFHQWGNEVFKHTDASYLKKVYILNHYRKDLVDAEANAWYTKTVPTIPQLLAHDLVIITSSYVLRLVTQNKGDMLGLEQIYWKRLIVDEGHSMHSKSRVSDICSNVFMSERKWAVSGTPTLGLTQLYMDEEEVKHPFDPKLDLTKLGSIIGQFLRLEPFFSSARLWHQTVIKPLETGAPLAELALTGLLDQIMVRHGDVEMELPPLHHKVMFLQPLYFNQLALNNFTAVLAANAVSSEREGIDYMFHPNNRGQLRRLVNNLRRATVFWTGFLIEDLEALIKVCTNCLERNDRDDWLSKYLAEDTKLLQRSRALAEVALANQRWRVSLVAHELLYYIDHHDLPLLFARSLALGTTNGEYVFGAPQLAVVQEVVYKNRFASGGKLREKMAEAVEKFNKQYSKEGVKRTKKFANDAETAEPPSPKKKRKPSYDTLPPSKDKLKQQRAKRAKQAKERVEMANLRYQEKLGHEKVEVADDDITTTTTFDRLRRCRILGTALAKLGYLVGRLGEHQATGIKLIIFFDFEDHAYYLAELMDVLGLNYILYATFISPHDRASNLDKFCEFRGGTALIMDLRLASHGLTIIDATRVYFISPVWQRLVEAQAIKRAHRIGQTQPVFVETLVLRDTLEEEMYRHRRLEDHEEKYVIDNFAMQQYIQRHKFLELGISEYVEFDAETVTDKHVDADDNEGGLLSHDSEVSFDNLRQWNMYLFLQDNLTKLNEAKAKIREKEESRKRRRPQAEPERVNSPRIRKKVRF